MGCLLRQKRDDEHYHLKVMFGTLKLTIGVKLVMKLFKIRKLLCNEHINILT